MEFGEARPQHAVCTRATLLNLSVPQMDYAQSSMHLLRFYAPQTSHLQRPCAFDTNDTLWSIQGFPKICPALRIQPEVSRVTEKWDEQVFRIGETIAMKKPSKHLIVEVPRSVAKGRMTIGIDLGDVWSHYCTLNEDGEVVDRGRFRTTPTGVAKWFTDVPRARVAMNPLDLG